MNSIIFDDEIVLYWELPLEHEKGDSYSLYVNDKKIKEGLKTHFRIDELQPLTEYSIRVERKDKNNALKDILVDAVYTTKPEVRKINVKSSLYNAAGDGETLDTKAIQRAIDDCKKGECVYLPEGVYLCGKLDLHSDMELYLEKGAVTFLTTSRMPTTLYAISSGFCIPIRLGASSPSTNEKYDIITVITTTLTPFITPLGS